MNNDIKNIIHKLCEDGHNAMVERRNANRQPIEDISPYEVSYNLIVEEFERLEKIADENKTTAKEMLKIASQMHHGASSEMAQAVAWDDERSSTHARMAKQIGNWATKIELAVAKAVKEC